jgi:hypothetical protein
MLLSLLLPKLPSILRFRGLLLLSLLPALAHAAPAPPVQPFTAVYQANYSGINVTATRSLKVLDDGSAELRFSAKSWLATIEEFSILRWQGQHLQPQRYEYHRVGMGRDRHAVLTFDWHKGKVRNNVEGKPWSMALPAGTLDKLSYQLQLQSDLLHRNATPPYSVADGGRLKEYHFAVEGEEILQTPLGAIATVKVRRVRPTNDERTTYLWLAKDWDYLLVRLRQQEDDGKNYEINLASAEINGQAVTGRH